jgi:hypothetical protein
MLPHLIRVSLAAGLSPLLAGLSVAAQTPSEIARERADYQAWLTTSASSPLFAVARQPLGSGVRLGPPDADIPLPGLPEHRVSADGPSLLLESPTGKRPVGRNRAIRLAPYTLFLTGSSAGTILTVFGGRSGKEPPGYYSYDGSVVFTGPLLPPEKPGRIRVLAPDGMETEAGEAGSVLVPLAGGTRLRVLRMPGNSDEESELEIFFQDSTNGQGSYPAGRFVSVIPVGGGKYRLDFNRARNPFCAYSTVYACPAPWRGNQLRTSIQAGERYTGGGLNAPSVDQEMR